LPIQSAGNAGRRKKLYWWTTAAVAAAAFSFGFVGMWQYEARSAGHVDGWSVFYHTLQLFILHAPHLEGPVPWSLHLGRLLAAALVSAATVLAFYVFFYDEWKLMTLRLPWTRGHVVICGLGDLGIRLALEGRKHKKIVVAIEKSCPPAMREAMRDQGVLVLDGDASGEDQLKAAQIHRADFVVAACPDDRTNVAIAAAAGKILASSRQRTAPVLCRTLIRNPDTRQLLSKQALLTADPLRYRVNFSDLDEHSVAARRVLRFHPLDLPPIREHDDTVVRLVIVGFGMAGQSLALHAARIGHFANEVGKGKKLRLTIVDPTERTLNDFKARHTKLDHVCDVEYLAYSPSPAFVSTLAELCPLQRPFTTQATYAICWDDHTDDERNFRLGTELSPSLKGRPAQILIRQTTTHGFAALLSKDHDGASIHPFGMVEDVFSWDVLVHESEESLARALHEVYRTGRLKNGEQVPGWDELGEEFRDSNRQAADHIPIKLRALGYQEQPLRKDKEPIVRFKGHEVDLLARMEHARWCAERYLAGWSYAEETNRSRKLSRALVEWHKLSIEEQKKDHEQINAIPQALHDVGLEIYG